MTANRRNTTFIGLLLTAAVFLILLLFLGKPAGEPYESLISQQEKASDVASPLSPTIELTCTSAGCSTSEEVKLQPNQTLKITLENFEEDPEILFFDGTQVGLTTVAHYSEFWNLSRDESFSIKQPSDESKSYFEEHNDTTYILNVLESEEIELVAPGGEVSVYPSGSQEYLFGERSLPASFFFDREENVFTVVAHTSDVTDESTGSFSLTTLDTTLLTVVTVDNQHKECLRTYCRLVDGEGPDQCEADDQCGHNECGAEHCVRVEGAGPDLCSSDTQCGSSGHRECNAGVCIAKEGAGPDLCEQHSDCKYKICRQPEDRDDAKAIARCVVVNGLPSWDDECSDDSDCNHGVCHNTGHYWSDGSPVETYECRNVPSPGKSQCQQGDDCKFKICNAYGYCAVYGGQERPDTCSKNSDCGYGTCEGYACKWRPGQGKGNCSKDEDCTYKSCNGPFCRTYIGSDQPDTCQRNRDCGGRYVCDHFSKRCKLDPHGDGPDECNSYYKDCTHKDCNWGGLFLCTDVPGKGPDKCSDDYDCMHKACEGTSCIYKPGLSKDTCQDSSDCHYKECHGIRCVRYPDHGGTRPDTCQDYSDCGGRLVCKYGQLNRGCRLVRGTGPDECRMHQDCFTEEELRSFREDPRPTWPPHRSGSSSSAGESQKKKTTVRASSLSSLVANGATLGSADAPVKIEMYQDIKCGMCRYAFESIIPELHRRYVETGAAQIIFREYPLIPRKTEMTLAQAAQCAGDQGGYIRFLGYIYSLGKDLVLEDLGTYATDVGLDAEKLQSCLDSGRHSSTVAADRAKAKELGIDGTPTFYINGVPVLGAQPIEKFVEVIEQEISE